MYKLIQNIITNKVDVAVINNTSFAFVPDNHDYLVFKQALQTGKNADGTDVQLEDASGTTMTSDQIATFLATLP